MKSTFKFIFKAICFILLENKTIFEEFISNDEKLQYIKANNYNEEIFGKITHDEELEKIIPDSYEEKFLIKITKKPRSKDFIFESNGISYRQLMIQENNISMFADKNIAILNKLFLDPKKKEIIFFLKRYINKNEIFQDLNEKIEILEKIDIKKYTNFINKEFIDSKKERNYIADNIYFINILNSEIFSSLPKESFSENQNKFIKKIKDEFENKKDGNQNLLIAFDKTNNNILGQAYYYYPSKITYHGKILEENAIYIDQLSINNSINFGKGIGTFLLNVISTLNPKIYLFSFDESVGFYEKFGLIKKFPDKNLFKLSENFNKSSFNKFIFNKLNI